MNVIHTLNYAQMKERRSERETQESGKLLIFYITHIHTCTRFKLFIVSLFYGGTQIS